MPPPSLARDSDSDSGSGSGSDSDADWALEDAGERDARWARHMRMMKMRRLMERERHGELADLAATPDLRRAIKESTFLLCHFYNPSFARCKLLNKHLEAIAPRFFGTRVTRLDVSRISGADAEHFGVRVLPCLMGFIRGAEAFRIVGFQDLGNTDDFDTKRLEELLASKGILSNTVEDVRLETEYARAEAFAIET